MLLTFAVEGSFWGKRVCGRGGDFASAEATKGRSPSGGFAIALWKPSPALFLIARYPTLAGRGGSVSRRDLNQLAGIRAQLAWARKSKGKLKLIPSCSSGGGPGEALLLEKRPPPEFLSVIFSLPSFG